MLLFLLITLFLSIVQSVDVIHEFQGTVFLNYRVKNLSLYDRLLKASAACLEPDLFDGSAWMSVVHAHVNNTWWGYLPLPFYTTFETDLRLYARTKGGERVVLPLGIFFSDQKFGAKTKSHFKGYLNEFFSPNQTLEGNRWTGSLGSSFDKKGFSFKFATVDDEGADELTQFFANDKLWSFYDSQRGQSFMFPCQRTNIGEINSINVTGGVDKSLFDFFGIGKNDYYDLKCPSDCFLIDGSKYEFSPSPTSYQCNLNERK